MTPEKVGTPLFIRGHKRLTCNAGEKNSLGFPKILFQGHFSPNVVSLLKTGVIRGLRLVLKRLSRQNGGILLTPRVQTFQNLVFNSPPRTRCPIFGGHTTTKCVRGHTSPRHNKPLGSFKPQAGFFIPCIPAYSPRGQLWVRDHQLGKKHGAASNITGSPGIKKDEVLISGSK